MVTELVKLEHHVRVDIVIVHNEGDENGEFLQEARKVVGERLSRIVLTCTEIKDARKVFNTYDRRVEIVVTSNVGWAQELKAQYPWLRVILNQERKVPELMRELTTMPPRVG